MSLCTEDFIDTLKMYKEKVNKIMMNFENLKTRFEEISKDDFFPFDHINCWKSRNWLDETYGNDVPEMYTLFDVLDEMIISPDENLIKELKAQPLPLPFVTQVPYISTRTFTRPRKNISRPSLNSVISNEQRTPLKRRLTTTISPTPALIGQLEELSRSHNRPLSASFADWDESNVNEALADLPGGRKSPKTPKHDVSTSVLNRLRQLKEANYGGLSVSPTPVETSKPKFVVGADVSRPAIAISRNLPDSAWSSGYESFVNIEDGRFSLGASMTGSFMNQPMTGSFLHDPFVDHTSNVQKDDNLMRMTFGGQKIPTRISSSPEDDDLNGTFVKDLIEVPDDLNKTEVFANTERIFNRNNHNNTFNVIDNRTFDAKSDNNLNHMGNATFTSATLKSTTSNGYSSKLFDMTYSRRSEPRRIDGTFTRNSPVDGRNSSPIRISGSPVQNSNAHNSPVRKSEGTYTRNSPVERRNGDAYCSEDEKMSLTSDDRSGSIEGSLDDVTSAAVRLSNWQQPKKPKKLVSTPKFGLQRDSADWQYSPIERETPDNSASSSRTQSPARPSGDIGPLKKFNLANVRDQVKVPQQELKLKPALARIPGNFKRPVSVTPAPTKNGKVAEPIKPVKPVKPVIEIRTSPEDQDVNNTTNNLNKTTNRVASAIPRPPSRLRQPQTRYTIGKSSVAK